MIILTIYDTLRMMHVVTVLKCFDGCGVREKDISIIDSLNKIIEHRRRARHCIRCWGHNSEQHSLYLEEPRGCHLMEVQGRPAFV